jgi:hypothetical protein
MKERTVVYFFPLNHDRLSNWLLRFCVVSYGRHFTEELTFSDYCKHRGHLNTHINYLVKLLIWIRWRYSASLPIAQKHLKIEGKYPTEIWRKLTHTSLFRCNWNKHWAFYIRKFVISYFGEILPKCNSVRLQNPSVKYWQITFVVVLYVILCDFHPYFFFLNT